MFVPFLDFFFDFLIGPWAPFSTCRLSSSHGLHGTFIVLGLTRWWRVEKREKGDDGSGGSDYDCGGGCSDGGGG